MFVKEILLQALSILLQLLIEGPVDHPLLLAKFINKFCIIFMWIAHFVVKDVPMVSFEALTLCGQCMGGSF